MSRIQDIPMVIIATCTLYNICLDSDDQSKDLMGDSEGKINGFHDVLPPGCGAVDKRNELIQNYC